MNLLEVLNGAKNGEKFRRESWPNKDYFLCINDDDIFDSKNNRLGLEDSGCTVDYHDLIGTDWVMFRAMELNKFVSIPSEDDIKLVASVVDEMLRCLVDKKALDIDFAMQARKKLIEVYEKK